FALRRPTRGVLHETFPAASAASRGTAAGPTSVEPVGGGFVRTRLHATGPLRRYNDSPDDAMSGRLTEVIKQVDALSPEEQRSLLAHLAERQRTAGAAAHAPLRWQDLRGR